jgi:serine/threonine-protein kinase
MEELYEEQIKRGPLVDSTPFGQSFQRMKTMDSSSISGSQPAVVTASQPTAEVVQPARRSTWPILLVATFLLVAGLGAGWAVFVRPQANETARAASEPARDETARPPEEAPSGANAQQQQQQPASTVGRVRVTSTPPGARVTIGEVESGNRTPLTMGDVAPGTQHVVVVLDGHQRWEGDVEVAAGEEATVNAELQPLVRAPVGPPGRISINTRPWSKVYVGRQLLGTTPIAEARVTSGQVRLRLVDRDGNTHTRMVRVAPNGTERVFFDLGGQ